MTALKQVNDQRQTRSEAFDQLHWKFVKQVKSYVRQCDVLQQEIEERELIRSVCKSWFNLNMTLTKKSEL